MESKQANQQQADQRSNSDGRAENRAAMPEVTRIVDEFREVFGPGVRVTYARENGREMGTPS